MRVYRIVGYFQRVSLVNPVDPVSRSRKRDGMNGIDRMPAEGRHEEVVIPCIPVRVN
jgi:hypothetical protein